MSLTRLICFQSGLKVDIFLFLFFKIKILKVGNENENPDDNSSATVPEDFDMDMVFEAEDSSTPKQDHMLNFHKDLLYYGVLMMAQKSCSQYGDGEGALAMWKNSMSDYNDEKKVVYCNFGIGT
jgi:hypothetical protein